MKMVADRAPGILEMTPTCTLPGAESQITALNPRNWRSACTGAVHRRKHDCDAGAGGWSGNETSNPRTLSAREPVSGVRMPRLRLDDFPAAHRFVTSEMAPGMRNQ